MNDPHASDIEHRKAEHLDICIHGDVESSLVSTGFERYRFRHTCLPELDFDDLDTHTTFLGWPLAAPLLISSMTGGTALAGEINRRLARAAQYFRIPMGVGSQRVLLEQPQIAETFAVRGVAPDTPLLANIGAVQLNYGCGIEDCRKIIEILDANALILHLNPLQEAVQTRGDRNFRGLLAKIGDLCQELEIPVIIKEVGNGISGAIATALIQAGVAAIDVAGAGGTSWAKVEAARATDPHQRALGQTFADWGIPTADCLQQIREHTRDTHPDYPLIASGGLKNGLDVAKAIALGADLAGLARPFLQAAHISEETLFEHIEITLAELKTVLFCTGCQNLGQLRHQSALIRLS